MKIIKKILSCFFILLISAIVIAGCILYIPQLFEKVDNVSSDLDKNWMSKVDDEKYISEIYIPGSNNSTTAHVQLPLFSKCQSLGIQEQLDSGVRYFDIRLGFDEDKNGKTILSMYNGFLHCKNDGKLFASNYQLDQVCYLMYNFLQAHPTETIIFNTKYERETETLEAFQHLLNEEIIDVNHSNKWLLTEDVPTLKKARGKIVLLRRYEDKANLKEKAGLNCYWENQDTSTVVESAIEKKRFDYYNVYVQDRNSYGIEDKYNAFKTNPSNLDPKDIYINVLSTKGPKNFGHAYKFAKTLNQNFLDDSGTFFRGWYVFDFINHDICHKIYSMNFED